MIVNFLLEPCQTPSILKVIFFGELIKDLVCTLVPIGLIIMLMVDFAKATISNDENAQLKSTKLVVKRIIYAVLIFIVPWIVTVLMTMLETVGLGKNEDGTGIVENYKLCTDTAKDIISGEQSMSTYEDLEAEEEKAEEEENKQTSIIADVRKSFYQKNLSPFFEGVLNNILQSDQRWGNTPLCTNKIRTGSGGDNRTIASSGCGFCSLTMVLRTMGQNTLTPDKVVDEVCSLNGGKSGYATPNDFVAIATKYGLSSKTWGRITSKEQANSTFTPLLKEGKRLIVNMPGHYISVLGLDSNGHIIVGDSARGYNTGGSKGGPYTMETLFTATVTANEPYWLNVTAIW